MNSKRGFIFFVLVLMLAFASVAGAYMLKSARWPTNAANYRCDPNLSSAFCDSVKYGAERWNNVSGSPFRWIYYSGSGNVAKLAPIDGSRGTVGRCEVTRMPSNSSFLQRVSAVFDSAESWYTGSSTPSSTKYDVRSLAAHELGHCLGLEHTQSNRCGSRVDEDDKPTMCEGSAFYDGETYLRSLETDDKNGVKARYPSTTTASSTTGFSGSVSAPTVFPEVCDTDLVDVDSFYAALSARERLKYSEVVVRGKVTNITATRFNSDENCTWEEFDERGSSVRSWTIFYAVELENVEAIRAGGYETGKTITVTILEKNPAEKEKAEKPLVEVGDEVIAYLTKGELQWRQGPAHDVFYPASSPRTSFLVQSSDSRFYELGDDDDEEGQTYEDLRDAVRSTKYHPE